MGLLFSYPILILAFDRLRDYIKVAPETLFISSPLVNCFVMVDIGLNLDTISHSEVRIFVI